LIINSTFAPKSTNHKYGKTMKKMTMDEKKALLVEVNKLLATIPDYQLAISVNEMEYADILITDQGYIKRLYLEYGEII